MGTTAKVWHRCRYAKPLEVSPLPEVDDLSRSLIAPHHQTLSGGIGTSSAVRSATRIINRMKAALIRSGIRGFKPELLLKAPQRLEVVTILQSCDEAHHAAIPGNTRMSISVSRRSVPLPGGAPHCDIEWMTKVSILRARNQRANQNPSRPASKARTIRVITRPAFIASSRQPSTKRSSTVGCSFFNGRLSGAVVPSQDRRCCGKA